MVIVNLLCASCKEVTPHRTKGKEWDPDRGEYYQWMECCHVRCGTAQKVYCGINGDEFQRNVDLPADLPIDDDQPSEAEAETEAPVPPGP